MSEAFWWVFGSHRHAIRALMDVIGWREIVAGVVPVHLERESRNAHRQPLAHDVSILPGIGRHFGSRPRANTSMTIMRPPQHGHGHGSTRGLSGAPSGSSSASAPPLPPFTT